MKKFPSVLTCLCLVTLPLVMTSCKALGSLLQTPGKLFNAAAGGLGFTDANGKDRAIQWDEELRQQRQNQEEIVPGSVPLTEPKQTPDAVAGTSDTAQIKTAAATP